jgi:Rieske [2Fe-2S] domain
METGEVTVNDWGAAGERLLYRSLRRYWHPVLYADDLGDRPQQVTLLDERIVIIRLAGEIRAFADRCAHRGTAVSLGWDPTASAQASQPGSARGSLRTRDSRATRRSSPTASST